MIVETEKGIEYIPKFWVDGREHRCKVPARESASAEEGSGASPASSGALEKRIESLETRIGQLIQASDDMRASFYRIILSVAMVIGVMVVLWIGWAILSSYLYRNKLPETIGAYPALIEIGGKPAIVYLEVKGWQVPPEVADSWFQAELKRRMDAAQKQNAATQAATQPTK
jgi:hypothetical protein